MTTPPSEILVPIKVAGWGYDGSGYRQFATWVPEFYNAGTASLGQVLEAAGKALQRIGSELDRMPRTQGPNASSASWVPETKFVFLVSEHYGKRKIEIDNVDAPISEAIPSLADGDMLEVLGLCVVVCT
jgi:hypothetical protein